MGNFNQHYLTHWFDQLGTPKRTQRILAQIVRRTEQAHAGHRNPHEYRVLSRPRQ